MTQGSSVILERLHPIQFTRETTWVQILHIRSAAVFVQAPTDPVIFISAAESYFLQAEARERYFSGDQAESLYNQGVLDAFTSVGQDGSSFITGAYKYPTGGSLQQKIEAIATQKWASFPYGVHFIEGFFEKQRTGYPVTSPVYSTDAFICAGPVCCFKKFCIASRELFQEDLHILMLKYQETAIPRN